MGKKHRNPWGGPPIDNLALSKHRNRDGGKLTVAQVAGAWLRPIYAFPAQPGDRTNWRFVACWDEDDEPFEIGVEDYGVQAVRSLSMLCRSLTGSRQAALSTSWTLPSLAGTSETRTGVIPLGDRRGG